MHPVPKTFINEWGKNTVSDPTLGKNMDTFVTHTW